MTLFRIATALLDDLTKLALGVIWRLLVLAIFITPLWITYHAI